METNFIDMRRTRDIGEGAKGGGVVVQGNEGYLRDRQDQVILKI